MWSPAEVFYRVMNEQEQEPSCVWVQCMLGNTHCTDEGQVQDGAQDWYSSDETYYNREETPGREGDREWTESRPGTDSRTNQWNPAHTEIFS